MTSTGTMGCTWEDQNQIAQLIGIDDTAKASQLSELLCNKWNATASMISSTNNSMDGAFVLTSASLVFFMQMGFAMLCAGAVRTKVYELVLSPNFDDEHVCSGNMGTFKMYNPNFHLTNVCGVVIEFPTTFLTASCFKTDGFDVAFIPRCRANWYQCMELGDCPSHVDLILS